MTRCDDFVNEVRPVVRPFLLEDGHQNQVQLVDQSSLRFGAVFGRGICDNEVDNEVTDACT